MQQCIVYLIRNSFRYASRQHRDGIDQALKSVYTALSEAAAKDRFTEFAAEWGQRYPAILKLRESSWAGFVPFLEYNVEISTGTGPMDRPAEEFPTGTAPTNLELILSTYSRQMSVIPVRPVRLNARCTS